MEERAQAITPLGTGRGNNPVFAEKGVPYVVKAMVAGADVIEGKGIGLLAIIENCGDPTGKSFRWMINRGGLRPSDGKCQENDFPECGKDMFH